VLERRAHIGLAEKVCEKAALAARVAANLPTPWVGVWERINLGVFLLCVVVLATKLLRSRDTAFVTGRGNAVAA
jgi:hypothetical protein